MYANKREFRKNLKSAHVVVISMHIELLGLVLRIYWGEGNAHVDHSLDSVGPKQAKVPSDEGTPVVPDHVEARVAGRVCRRVRVAEAR